MRGFVLLGRHVVCAGTVALLIGCHGGAAQNAQKECHPIDAGDIWTGSVAYDASPAGKLPPGWTTAYTRGTGKAEWSIVADESAPSKPNVLALKKTDSPRRVFNLCVLDKTAPADLELTVKFKAASGEVDQGGGPVWRYQDADNYYVCRANPLESNFRLYKVTGGSRKKLASVECEISTGEWHTIRVTMKGDKIDCWLNGANHLEAVDDTIAAPGRVGLWTKADAATAFDDLVAKALP